MEGDTEGEVQANCVSMLRLCEGQVELFISRDRADSYSDDLGLTQDEEEPAAYVPLLYFYLFCLSLASSL